MKIAQDQTYKGDDWWEWAVWIEAPPATFKEISKVIWHLHPTFPDPVRERTNRQHKFRLNTAGWGGFTVRADVLMQDGTRKRLSHELELYYQDDADGDVEA